MANNDLNNARVAALQLFAGYTDEDLQILMNYQDLQAKPEPGFITDFLGGRTRTSSLWKEARTLDGQLLPLPVPGDYHAEAIEWIGLLKAVSSARGKYVAMELGAGFGPWIVAGALAARSRQVGEIKLCAVEGDPEHFNCLRQHFIDNGFDPAEHRLLQAAVGSNAGIAFWPVMDAAASHEDWGLRPMQSDSDYTGRQFQKTMQVTILAMRDLILAEPEWDLVHIDVQGEEVDICRSAIEELNARVRWLIIGTHSRKLDGDLLELLGGAGWMLEHEKPAKFVFAPNYASLEAMTTLDGTQVWRNPRFWWQTESSALQSFAQSIESSEGELRLSAGGLYSLALHITNCSDETWQIADAVRPVTASYRWKNSAGEILPVEGKRAVIQERTILPGQRMQLQLPVQAPETAGAYTLLVSMVQEGVAWFMDRGGEPLTLSAIVS